MNMKHAIKHVVRHIAVTLAGISILTGMVTATTMASPAEQQTGSLTIRTASDQTDLKGYKFNLYRVVSISTDGQGVMSFSAEKGYEAALADVKNLGNPAEVEEVIAKLSKTAGQKNPTASSGEIETEMTEYQFSDLPIGYYLMKVTAPEGGSITSDFLVSVPFTQTDGSGLLYDVVMTLKTPKVTIAKTAQAEHSDTTGAGENRTIMVGDTVTYTLHLKVPDTTGYASYTYTVKDTMSRGLQFAEDSLKVMMGDKEFVRDRDYTLTASIDTDTGETKLVLEFNKDLFTDAETLKNPEAYPAGVELKVIYQAVITLDALEDPQGGMTNDAKLIYSNDPGSDGEGLAKDETPVPEKPKFHTFSIKLTKTFDPVIADYSKVRFAFDGPVLKKLESGKYVPELSEDADKAMNQDLELSADGTLMILGVGEGEYSLTEVRTEEGYNLLQNKVKIVIAPEFAEDGSIKGYKTGTSTPDATHTVNVEVLNKKGFTLPATGGQGVAVPVIAGICLMAGMTVLLIAILRKRRNG